VLEGIDQARTVEVGADYLGADERHAGAARALAEVEGKLRGATDKCRALESLSPAERELHAEQIGRLRAMEDLAREVRERRLEQVGERPPAESSQARTELPLAEQVLAMRRAWDRGVAAIEGYRQEHGIKDRDNALGKEPVDGFERADWTAQRSRLAEQQRTLQLQQGRSASLELDNDMSIGR